MIRTPLTPLPILPPAGKQPAKKRWRSIGARVFIALAILAVGAGFAVERRLAPQTSLRVSFGPTGLAQLSWRGMVLEDVQQNPSDAFHIWHMKVTDLQGNLLSQDGWGETNLGRQWDPVEHSWTYTFAWGSIKLQYVATGDRLDLNVTEINQAGSGVILAGATLYPLVLHLPALPAGFGADTYPRLSDDATAPGVVLADFGSGLVATVVTNAARPLYSGFLPAGASDAYTPLISSTAPDGLASFQPHLDRPVAPGQTDHFTVSLRFANSGTPLTEVASDAYTNWSKTWPMTLHWTDRRILGTAYLASSPSGDPHLPAGYPNNPRRYFNDSLASDFDVRTAEGLALFQKRILAQATNIVQNLRQLKAQGVITWDIEGEQYPQQTSYVCSPDQIAAIAPEMESVVKDAASPYAGMRLDDAYFKTIRDAGFRVGLCVRPQQFTRAANGTASQQSLPEAQVAAELLRKMRYAHDRWGITIFYLDSTVAADGGTLPPSIFATAAQALPDSLLIPEESSPKFYAYTAPFRSFLFHGETGTNPGIYAFYPKAFSAVLVNDVDPIKLAAAQPALTDAVRHGDILMVHADYWQANNPAVLEIYADAAAAPDTH